MRQSPRSALAFLGKSQNVICSPLVSFLPRITTLKILVLGHNLAKFCLKGAFEATFSKEKNGQDTAPNQSPYYSILLLVQTSTTTFWSLKRPAAYVHANPVGTLLDLGRVTQTLPLCAMHKHCPDLCWVKDPSCESYNTQVVASVLP